MQKIIHRFQGHIKIQQTKKLISKHRQHYGTNIKTKFYLNKFLTSKKTNIILYRMFINKKSILSAKCWIFKKEFNLKN
jgi:hypothetical protein